MTFLILLLACRRDASEEGPGPTRDPLSPFPNAWLVEDGRLAIAEGLLPQVEEGTPLPTARLETRSGFSPAQTAVVDLDVALDASLLPRPDSAIPGEGAVQVWDLDAGQPLRVFAELDAWPEPGDELPSLLIRPMQPYTAGHEIAVVLTRDLADTDGEELASPAWFAAARAGRAGEHLAKEAASTPELLERLAALGVDDPLLAFSFPVDDGGPLLDAMLADVPVPSEWTWDEIADVDAGDGLPDGAWRQLKGSYTVASWLGERDSFEIVDGLATRQGEAQASLFVHVPQSARDAAPGTVPVWIFGHGIFGDPTVYLEDDADPSAVVELSERAGAILVATTWTGLSRVDIGPVLGVAQDFGRIPEVTDPLAQALVNQAALVRLLLEGGLLDDPELGGLPDKGRLFYYGISLGGIEGAVLLAHEERLEHAVLHAAGSAWSTMLERSYAWQALEPLVVETIPSARDRQILYAASQLWWDPVDPATVAGELSARSILWQECLGDDMVPNLSTELMARGVGMTLLTPSTTTPSGLQSAAGPLSGPALFQFDPQLAPPPEANRPSDRTEAHNIPRVWEAAISQTARFLDREDPGVAEAPCGDEPCTAANAE